MRPQNQPMGFRYPIPRVLLLLALSFYFVTGLFEAEFPVSF
jgi:hypothetical protein